MTILLDTNSFVWWRTGNRRLSRNAARAIELADRIGLPDMVLWETARLFHLGRIRASLPPAAWLEAALAEPRIEVIPITIEIAVAAAGLQQTMSKDPVDSIVAATALRLGMPLITSDASLRDHALFETIW